MLFDLSFRRHGALLIYDPNKEVVKHVVNRRAVIGDDQPDGIHKILAADVHRLAIGQGMDGLGSRKKLLIELASIDGAVIFDNEKILAFGAIIESHPKAGQESGARTTAAISAYHWGGKPMKVSSDGEITLYFRNLHDGSMAEMGFL